ncbi:putative damage-inducible protein DinB [Thalassobacillus devorans]|nr:putative damage-inducible protein DinB [Thalassobacillus devorans]
MERKASKLRGRYHVMEDEINHRGQIRVIKRMLAEK